MNAATTQPALTATFAPGSRTACPCCGKAVKVSKAGALASHGYKAGNMYSVSAAATCAGSGATSVQAAMLVQVERAETELARATSVLAAQPGARNAHMVERAGQALEAARKAAGL